MIRLNSTSSHPILQEARRLHNLNYRTVTSNYNAPITDNSAQVDLSSINEATLGHPPYTTCTPLESVSSTAHHSLARILMITGLAALPLMTLSGCATVSAASSPLIDSTYSQEYYPHRHSTSFPPNKHYNENTGYLEQVGRGVGQDARSFVNFWRGVGHKFRDFGHGFRDGFKGSIARPSPTRPRH